MARERDGSQKSSVSRRARQGDTGSLIEREEEGFGVRFLAWERVGDGSRQHDDRLGLRETDE
jgi:hypothetical protein